MINIDLITGFLGAGKTTFLKKYAKYYIDRGRHVGILENDLGAVNVDMLMLQDLRGDNCEIEMVIGGDKDSRYRRLKTKLISMKMSGYDRVIMEPSGIFDMDEFYDILHEEPLDRWYEVGNIIAVMDVTADYENMSDARDYVTASQLANAGAIILSRLDKADATQIEAAHRYLDGVTERYHTRRSLGELVVKSGSGKPGDVDMDDIAACGYQLSNYVKRMMLAEHAYTTVYLLDHGMGEPELRDYVRMLFERDDIGEVYRVKGFFGDDMHGWRQINATKLGVDISDVGTGQSVLIIVGDGLREREIKDLQKRI